MISGRRVTTSNTYKFILTIFILQGYIKYDSLFNLKFLVYVVIILHKNFVKLFDTLLVIVAY